MHNNTPSFLRMLLVRVYHWHGSVARSSSRMRACQQHMSLIEVPTSTTSRSVHALANTYISARAHSHSLTHRHTHSKHACTHTRTQAHILVPGKYCIAGLNDLPGCICTDTGGPIYGATACARNTPTPGCGIGGVGVAAPLGNIARDGAGADGPMFCMLLRW